ncbi:MAG TPA: hypothetical protein DCE41_32375, partial [Cytophagales bacterium]|nr:hypothetical protein [Cytophagales bacterium]
GNSSYTDVYAVFLILKDGTHFWLYEVTNKKDRAIELAVEIQQYLGMKLEDSQGIGASAEASRSYQRQEENHNFRASAQLKTQTVQGGTEYTFRKRPSFSHRFTLFLVAYFFTGIPTFILTMVMDNGGGFGLWFVIPILVIFVAILFLVYLVQARQYRVIAGPERLEIQVKFRNALVQARLGRTFILTREQIQAVRLNRLQHGNFWLSLSLSPGAALNRTSSLLVNMGAFGKNASLTTQDKYTTLGLWEIPLAANAKREPYLGDLLVVKDALERLYENE